MKIKTSFISLTVLPGLQFSSYSQVKCTRPSACHACLCRGCLPGPGPPSAREALESPPSWGARYHAPLCTERNRVRAGDGIPHRLPRYSRPSETWRTLWLHTPIQDSGPLSEVRVKASPQKRSEPQSDSQNSQVRALCGFNQVAQRQLVPFWGNGLK